MKKIMSIVGIFILFSSCQEQNNESLYLEGDLYYTWLKLGNFYGLPDSLCYHYEYLKDSLGIDEFAKQNSKLMPYIKLLEEWSLVKSPFIYLKMDSSVVIVYLSKDDYEPITKYTYQDLIDTEQKVRLKLVTNKLNTKLYLCKEVISMERIDGETLQKEKKFKIEDYR